ncbi:hypothetical protein GCM10022224_057770 [Nonomuraea antimicrobica]|uniref:4Fe-4S Wbl-type domain-containing protein n=1 Tax=Nonomuraea antimicrobica TaxID=561173 RepID=A0ABP7CE00_9ACTN
MERDVLSRWRGRSLAAGWSLADDWWTPEVDVVAKAVCGGCDLAQACWALGSARAGAGGVRAGPGRAQDAGPGPVTPRGPDPGRP